MPRITVIIDPVGKATVEGHDFTDSSCKQTLKPIEDALFGAQGATSTEDKPEAQIPASNPNLQQQSGW